MRTLSVSPEFRVDATKVIRRRLLRSPFSLFMVVVAFAAGGWLVVRDVAWAAPLLVVFVLLLQARSLTREARVRVDRLFPEGATVAVSVDGESLTTLDAAGISSVFPLSVIASVERGPTLVFLRLRDHPSAIAVPAALLDEADLAALAEAATPG